MITDVFRQTKHCKPATLPASRLRLLLPLLTPLLLGGCEQLGLVEPLGGTKAPEEKTAEFRIVIDVTLPDDGAADEVTLWVWMPGDDDAPTDLQLGGINGEDLPYRYTYEDKIDRNDVRGAYVKTSSNDGNGGAFAVRIRYWETGAESKPLLLDRLIESGADGRVETAFAIPR